METTTDDVGALLGLVSVVAGAVVLYLLNERSKRLWALSDEEWSLKYDALTSIMVKLWEMSVVHKCVDEIAGKPEPTLQNIIEDQYFEVLVIWQVMNSRFFAGQMPFPSTKNTPPEHPSSDDLEDLKNEIAEIMQIRFNLMEYELIDSVSRLRLIVRDQDLIRIVYECQDTIDKALTDEIYTRKAIEDYTKLFEEFKKSARDELEGTRTRKGPRYRLARTANSADMNSDSREILNAMRRHDKETYLQFLVTLGFAMLAVAFGLQSIPDYTPDSGNIIELLIGGLLLTIIGSFAMLASWAIDIYARRKQRH